MVSARIACWLLIVSLVSGLSVRTLDAHPLHTTLTALVEDGSRGTVRATVRVFADDLETAVLRWRRGRREQRPGAAWDREAIAYASTVLAMQDSRGRVLPVRSCGVRHTGDIVWLCLEADVSRAASSLRVRNTMLCELFEDQVNVVQRTVGGRRRTLLFVRGDSFKAIG